VILLKSAKPATEMVSGLRKSEQLSGELGSRDNPQCLSIQAVDVSGSLEFALNAREVIPAEISAFNSQKIFNVRRWYRAEVLWRAWARILGGVGR
jgi:hypothetical protein